LNVVGKLVERCRLHKITVSNFSERSGEAGGDNSFINFEVQQFIK